MNNENNIKISFFAIATEPLKNGYPIIECITSILSVADEIIIIYNMRWWWCWCVVCSIIILLLFTHYYYYLHVHCVVVLVFVVVVCIISQLSISYTYSSQWVPAPYLLFISFIHARALSMAVGLPCPDTPLIFQ